MFEKILAAAGFVVCAALLLRLLVGPARRRRWDAFGRRLASALRRRASALRRAPRPPSDEEAVRREAERLIERARRASPPADHDGNVVRPRAFDPSRRKKPPLH